eukprot:TRINITY_DN6141_c3_g1_i1.p1 TRINITY_DN6141_c3_g1~~TRINITY_DN6141_c3_g1_i1.p1  ORF type:complete len:625 (-),score=122.25 TRINITY_DN6141_c3_g1_i1:241-2115(-)
MVVADLQKTAADDYEARVRRRAERFGSTSAPAAKEKQAAPSHQHAEHSRGSQSHGNQYRQEKDPYSKAYDPYSDPYVQQAPPPPSSYPAYDPYSNQQYHSSGQHPPPAHGGYQTSDRSHRDRDRDRDRRRRRDRSRSRSYSRGRHAPLPNHGHPPVAQHQHQQHHSDPYQQQQPPHHHHQQHHQHHSQPPPAAAPPPPPPADPYHHQHHQYQHHQHQQHPPPPPPEHYQHYQQHQYPPAHHPPPPYGTPPSSAAPPPAPQHYQHPPPHYPPAPHHRPYPPPPQYQSPYGHPYPPPPAAPAAPAAPAYGTASKQGSDQKNAAASTKGKVIKAQNAKKFREDASEGWSSTSEEEELPQNGAGATPKKKKKKKNRNRQPKKKALPPAELTLQKMPLFGGAVPGPIGASQPWANWKLVMEDHHRRSYVSHRKKAFRAETLKTWWESLAAKISWDRPSKEDFVLPRSTCWLTRSNCSCEYEYFGLSVPPSKMDDWFLEITDAVCRTCGIKVRPNSCNANYYASGNESVSWHSDDEPLFDAVHRDALIISLSLGTARKFELRSKDDPEACNVLTLEDGDLCTMEGLCQKHYKHRVATEPGLEGPRINLTWRWVCKHDATCPLSSTCDGEE